jgi:hypothetical protein
VKSQQGFKPSLGGAMFLEKVIAREIKAKPRQGKQGS